MAKVRWKGSALLGPLPTVMVSCGDMEHPNIITVAWAGIVNTHPPKLSISVRPGRFSYGLIRESGEFVVNMTPTSLVKQADFCGMYTGAKVNKFEKTGLTPVAASEVSCPMIEECPMSLECRVTDVIPMGTHDLFLADIVAVHANEELLDEKGKLHVERANLVAFAHGEYFELGKCVGAFGDSVRKKPGGKKPAHHKKKTPNKK